MKFLLPCMFLLLAACADGRDARPNADRIAASGGLTRMELSTRPFRLVGYVRFAAVPVLRVYIEGDGHAWASPDRPSDDPTPWAPVALALAARDPSASVAYLGRPCQYVALGSDPTCEAYFWTDGRYHESVIASMNAAIAGYPDLTVPIGMLEGLPLGMSFIGEPWSEQTLLAYAFAYEQASHKRVPPEAYKKAVAAK